MKKTLLLGFILFFAGFFAASGQTWDGSSSSNWNTNGNWTPGAKPTATSAVTIPNVTTDPIVSSAAAVCSSILIESGGFLTVSSNSLTVGTGGITLNAGSRLVVDGGTATINGNLTIASGAVLQVTGGTLTVNGTITSATSAANFLISGGTLNSNGTGVSSASGITIANTANSVLNINAGQFNLQANSTCSRVINVASGATLQVLASQVLTLNNNNSRLNIASGGTLTLASASRIDLTTATATINHIGNLSIPANTSILGTSSFGVLVVSGSISNSGTINVNKLTMKTDGSSIQGTGAYSYTIKSLDIDANVNSQANIEDVNLLDIVNPKTFTIESNYVQLDPIDGVQPTLNAAGVLAFGTDETKEPTLRYAGFNYGADGALFSDPAAVYGAFGAFKPLASSFVRGKGTVWYNANDVTCAAALGCADNVEQMVYSGITYYNLKVSLGNGGGTGAIAHIGVADIKCDTTYLIVPAVVVFGVEITPSLLIIGSDCATNTINHSLPVFVENDFTLTTNAGATNGVGGLLADLYVGGDIVIENNATLNNLDESTSLLNLGYSMAQLRALGTTYYDVYLGGDWINNGSFITNNLKSVTLKGGNAPLGGVVPAATGSDIQNIAGTSVTTFNNLTLNKNGASNTKEVVITQGAAAANNNVIVGNNLTLTNSRLRLNHRTLSVTNTANTAIGATGNGGIISEEVTATAAPLGGSNFKIDGRVKWQTAINASVYTIPFRTLDNSVAVSLSFQRAGGILGEITASTASWNDKWTLSGLKDLTIKPSNYDGSENVTHMKDTMTHFSASNIYNADNVAKRFWAITKENGTSSEANVIFRYDIANESPNIAIPGDELNAQRWSTSTASEPKVYPNVDSEWMLPGLSATTQSYIPGTVTANGIQRFSIWTLASKTKPLPVSLLSFTAKRVSNTEVSLKWAAAQERNSRNFEVQRSTDGRSFTTIGTVRAAGQSSNTTEYSFSDRQPLRGLVWYRLIQNDQDGRSELSRAVSVNINTLPEPRLEPNPARNNLSILLGDELKNPNDKIAVVIKDVNGREIFTATISGNNSSIDISSLGAGVYFVELPAEIGLSHLRFVKQ